MDLRDCGAIVCGGASGLGEAVARAVAADGAKLVIFDLNESAGRTLAKQLDGLFFRVDVTDTASIAAGLDGVEQAFGAARILVNCAGIVAGSRTVQRDGSAHDAAQFRKVVDVNLIGAFVLASQFAARLSRLAPIREERGVIINTASIAAFDGQIGQAAYAASKGGITAMTLPMARDLAALGIRVVTIAPGVFRTPMMDALPPEAQKSLAAAVPFPNRLGDPSEFAQLVRCVIGNPMLNGETIRLDGALRMGPR